MSVGELAMTPRISLVAVCCSKDSLSSLNNRTFSIAITAWSAKVVTRSICLSVKTELFPPKDKYSRSQCRRVIEALPARCGNLQYAGCSCTYSPDQSEHPLFELCNVSTPPCRLWTRDLRRERVSCTNSSNSPTAGYKAAKMEHSPSA